MMKFLLLIISLFFITSIKCLNVELIFDYRSDDIAEKIELMEKIIEQNKKDISINIPNKKCSIDNLLIIVHNENAIVQDMLKNESNAKIEEAFTNFLKTILDNLEKHLIILKSTSFMRSLQGLFMKYFALLRTNIYLANVKKALPENRENLKSLGDSKLAEKNIEEEKETEKIPLNPFDAFINFTSLRVKGVCNKNYQNKENVMTFIGSMNKMSLSSSTSSLDRIMFKGNKELKGDNEVVEKVEMLEGASFDKELNNSFFENMLFDSSFDKLKSLFSAFFRPFNDANLSLIDKENLFEDLSEPLGDIQLNRNGEELLKDLNKTLLDQLENNETLMKYIDNNKTTTSMEEKFNSNKKKEDKKKSEKK